jgi:hypothetical protein
MLTNKINIKKVQVRTLRESRGRDARGGGVGHARPEGREEVVWSPARYRLLDSLESGVVGLLLLSVVVSVVGGSGITLFVTMLVAWALLPILVGFRNVLEAGCAFMLISVGILVVVGVAQYGPSYLLP